MKYLRLRPSFKITSESAAVPRMLEEDMKLLDLRQKWLLTAQEAVFASFFLKSPKGNAKAGPGGPYPHRAFMSQLRIPKFRKP